MDNKWAPNQNYKVTAVPLDGGLDFVSPPSMVKPGTLTDCLNYEVVDRNGYRRIDGFYKWDNAYTLESDQQYEITVTQVSSGSSAPGEFLCVSSSNPPFGILTAIINTFPEIFVLRYWKISSGKEPKVGDSITTLRSLGSRTTWQNLGEPVVSSITGGVAINPSDGSNGFNGTPPLYPTDTYQPNGVSSYDAYLTDRPVTALKYFNNTAYMVMDAPVVYLLGSGFYPGDVIGDENQAFIILSTKFLGGISTTEANVLWLEPNRRPLSAVPTQVRQFCSSSMNDPVLARTGQPVTFNGFRNRELSPSTVALLFRSDKISTYLSPGYKGSLGNFASTSGGPINNPPIVTLGNNGGGFGGRAVGLWDSTLGLRSIALTSGGVGYSSPPTVTVTDTTNASTGTASVRKWDWAGWRAINTGWKFKAAHVKSPSGFLPTVNRTKGPTAQVSNYTTGSYSGKPFFGLSALNFEGANLSGTTVSNATINISDVQDTGGGTLNLTFVGGFGSTYPLGPVRSRTMGVFDFANLREQIPTNSVITGLEFKISYTPVTPGGFSVPLPGVADVRDYNARCWLVKHGELNGNAVRRDVKVGDMRIAPIDASLTGLQTITAGSSTDLWGTEGLTIDDLVSNFGVGFDVGMTFVNTCGVSFQIDKVELVAHYRSASITYYFSSGSSTTYGNANTVDATLVNYHTESGELTQENWKGDWQVADLGNVNYAVSDGIGLVTVTAGGTGYTTAPTVVFTGGGGSGAAATAVIKNGAVIGVVITNPGTGYTLTPTVTFTGGGGTGATATCIVGALPGIHAGMGIYLDPLLQNRIGFVSENMSYNGLDSYSQLEEESSRYEIINANFYADESWEGIYGVSGAGRAWYFDGNYFSRIYAIPLSVEGSAGKDKPRHICNYRYHLALGYKSGSVQFSKIGEPENFDFVLGATEVGIGDRVTGIFPLPGQYLAVFCENSIWGITGKTTSEFSLENISPYSGAIEYSIVAIGDKPIYCDTMGISTLEQSDKYGNFLGNRLSHKISPWLLPRLNNRGSATVSGNREGFVAAYPVRSKNQYRLWFNDGLQLVLSFVGPEQEPQFTFTRLLLGGVNLTPNTDSPDTPLYLKNISQKAVPLALDSEVDENGNEQIIVSFDLTKSNQLFSNINARLVCPYVYKLDYLNQFGEIVSVDTSGETNVETLSPLSIPAYFQTAFSTIENPFSRKTIRKIRLEGTSRGEASVSLFTEKNYKEPDLRLGEYVTCSQTLASGSTWLSKSSYKPWTAIANVAETDRVIVVRAANFDKTNRRILDITGAVGIETYYYVTTTKAPGDTIKMYPEPAHYLQLMLVQYEEGKQDA